MGRQAQLAETAGVWSKERGVQNLARILIGPETTMKIETRTATSLRDDIMIDHGIEEEWGMISFPPVE